MIKEAFGTGATAQEAAEAAKKALGAPWDADVKVEITEAAKKKVLGLFGGSPAKARAYYEVADEVKPQKQSEPKPVAKKAEPSVPVAEKKVESSAAEAPVETAEAPKNTFVSEASETAAAYIRSILEGMGVAQIEVDACESEDGIFVQLNCGNDYGYVIGRRGETLDAIQYLTRLVVNKGSDNYKRVSVNAGNYREKRKDTLRELAAKNAAKVKKYGRSVCLDPMNPYERRIIHTAIQEIEGVDSHSVGTESERRVVITLADGFKPTNPGGGRNRRGDRRNYDKSAQQEQPNRAPRSDAATVGLYGKIEPKAKTEE
ncbi:MAG: KH domain-containing protein [Clostridia bacterium]|nr:KH domain-containing protein [Clostridia bacterium]